MTDNGPQFASKEFKRFCQQQGILQTLTPPYHPRSNGQAERFVQSFKQAVRKGLEEPQAKLDEVVQSFLAVYRNTAHSTTGASPAQLLMNRNLRCQLDMLFPSLGESGQTELLQGKVQKSQRKQKDTRQDGKAQRTVPGGRLSTSKASES